MSEGECDIPEFCDGKNGQCPDDLFKKNGAICSGGLGYCFQGQCPLLKIQCQNVWGEDAENANAACYERLNILGTPNGNCGYDNKGDIRKCAIERFVGERYLSGCVIERHSGLTPRVMVWGVISYHERSNLLRIEDNHNSNRYVREVLQPDVVPFLQGMPGAILVQDKARQHVAKTFRDFCSTQHM
ncbi:disintegrin and metalloproteinase domain-containing protein 33 [Trichonephila clavipes]|nr:disintegrin and metalloproteinase domain-containing protein 33 [Trichonephila clavipes]